MRTSWAGLGTLIALLGSKIGTKFGLKILSSLLGKVGIGKTGLAATSMISYSLLFTWEFAAMIMLMLFVHESGHVWAMNRYGMKTKGIYFIPFVGGAAVAEDEFPTRSAEVVVAIMGPIWGLALAVATGVVWIVTDSPLFAAGASWMALINLFNLLPINPLDGGRIFKSIAFSINPGIGLVFLTLGLAGCIIATVVAGMFLFVAIFLVGAIELGFEYRRSRSRVREYASMPMLAILVSALGYLVVAGLLFGLMSYMGNVPGADLAMEVLKG